MKKILGGLLAAAVLAACGSPPSAPESLWDSLPSPVASDESPPSESEPAKQVPAKGWEGESEEAGAPSDAPPAAPPVEEDIQGRVVFNEIYYDAPAADTDGVVFVELYGVPGLPIGGVRINFVDGGDGSVDDTITLPEHAVLAEDGYYVVADARTGAPGATSVPGANLIDNFDPQNGPDSVQLVDASGLLLDAVAYGEGTVSLAENGLAMLEGSPAPDVVNGHSLERAVPGADSDDNAADFVGRETPTPGR